MKPREEPVLKKWAAHQQALEQLTAQKAEWQAELVRLSESGAAEEADLDRQLVLENKIASWPRRVSAMRQRSHVLEAELKAAVDEKRRKVQPLAAQAAEKKLAAATEQFKEMCGGNAELAAELALQTPAVEHAFERCRINSCTNAVEWVAEWKRLASVQAELEAEARGETVAIPTGTFERLQREHNEALVKQAR